MQSRRHVPHGDVQPAGDLFGRAERPGPRSRTTSRSVGGNSSIISNSRRVKLAGIRRDLGRLRHGSGCGRRRSCARETRWGTGLLRSMLHTVSGVERDSRKLIRLLERDGWVRVAVRGSHWQFRHPDRSGRITVSHPNRNIKRGTLASIYRRAGWSPGRG